MASARWRNRKFSVRVPPQKHRFNNEILVKIPLQEWQNAVKKLQYVRWAKTQEQLHWNAWGTEIGRKVPNRRLLSWEGGRGAECVPHSGSSGGCPRERASVLPDSGHQWGSGILWILAATKNKGELGGLLLQNQKLPKPGEGHGQPDQATWYSMSEIKDEERILKAAREERLVIYKENP